MHAIRSCEGNYDCISVDARRTTNWLVGSFVRSFIGRVGSFTCEGVPGKYKKGII